MYSLFIHLHHIQCIHQLHEFLVVSTAARIPQPQPFHPPRLQELKRSQATIDIRVLGFECNIEL
jgi:hypothetical protein